MPHRYLFGLLTALYLVFAFRQLSGPDPAVWVSLHLIPAALMAAGAIRSLPRPLFFSFALFYLFLAAWSTQLGASAVSAPAGSNTLELLTAGAGLLLAAWLIPRPALEYPEAWA